QEEVVSICVVVVVFLALLALPAAVVPTIYDRSNAVPDRGNPWMHCMECVRREVVFTIDQLKVGDHIVFYGYTYDHHGIVTKINRQLKSIKVIEATNTFLGSMFGIIRFQKARIIESVKRPNFKRKYTNNKIVQWARKLARDYKYNVFNNNCEHFATECVTGHAFSAQIGKYEIALKLFWQGGLSAIFDERKRNMSMNRSKHICDICYKKNTLLLRVPLTPITKKK
ncbi:hypothetical protein MAR_035159, partial [Mya arenaria]